MEKKTDCNCIFCKIISSEIPSKTVFEDDEFKAILDISPASEGHVIILPKYHAANIYELPDELAGKVMITAKKIATAVKNAFGCDGVNILQNNGEAAGQTVFHLHVHVIPRYKNDTVNVIWKQRNDIDLDAVFEKIVKAL